jgi:hypothetical protein
MVPNLTIKIKYKKVMSKKKTKELMIEVTNHINTQMGFEVLDSFSDWGDKFSVLRKNPDYEGDEEMKIPFKKYLGVCEISVFKNYRKEVFVIWDYRENQPFYYDEHCVSESFLGFGRYEFTEREDFYNHISSDFGFTPWDRKYVESNSKPIEELG